MSGCAGLAPALRQLRLSRQRGLQRRRRVRGRFSQPGHFVPLGWRFPQRPAARQQRFRLHPGSHPVRRLPAERCSLLTRSVYRVSCGSTARWVSTTWAEARVLSGRRCGASRPAFPSGRRRAGQRYPSGRLRRRGLGHPADLVDDRPDGLAASHRRVASWPALIDTFPAQTGLTLEPEPP